MSSLFQTAVSGLNDAVARIANAATNIVNASSTRTRSVSDQGATTEGYTPTDVVTLSQSTGDSTLGVTSKTVARSGGALDIAAELVDANTAALSYKANAAIIKVARENDKSLFDALT